MPLLTEAFALADEIGVLEEGRLVQFGTPEEVYNHPATLFVARFTGLAGELPVQVSACGSDGTVEVLASAGAGRLPLMRGVAGSADGLRAGLGAGALGSCCGAR